MAKDKEERIRELMKVREALIYQAVQHPWVYGLPVIIGLLGVAIVFLTNDEVMVHLPERVHALGGRWLVGAKETFLGYWMMGGAVLFSIKFKLEAMHLIQIVTNQRVVQVEGAFTTNLHELPLHHITQIKIKRGTILNRLLHRGDIIMRNKKDDKEIIKFKGVSRPDEFVEHLRAAQARYNDSLALQERVNKERAKN